MTIKLVPIYNPQKPSHLKPEWVAKAVLNGYGAGIGKTGKATGTGMGISLTTPNLPRNCTRFLVCYKKEFRCNIFLSSSLTYVFLVNLIQ